MSQSPVTYEWECPICGASGTGLAHGHRSPAEDEAKNAIVGHVRQTIDNQHGRENEISQEFEEIELADFVRFKERFGGKVAPDRSTGPI